MDYKQIRLSFFIVWLTLSGIILLILATPFLLSQDVINTIMPLCELKAKFNKECSLCGMTTSFYYISQGKFNQAFMANWFSPYLFTLFVVNEVTMMVTLFKKIKQRNPALNLTLLNIAGQDKR